MKRLGLLLLSPALAAGAVVAQPDDAARCVSLSDCIAALRTAAQNKRQVGQAVEERLITLGPPAVDALVPLLADPDLQVRASAGMTLGGFDSIDPRHLPALVHAWRHGDVINRQGRGNGWMPRAIAATGTEEALRLLWQDYLRDPHHSSNAQVFMALAQMGERARPLILGRLAACRTSADDEGCDGVYQLLGEWKQPFPEWSIDAIVELALHAQADGVREAAQWQLGRRQHPAVLPPLQRRLADLDPAQTEPWDVSHMIDLVAAYGRAARASGPAIVRYLAPEMHEDVRARAALALGEIDETAAIPALMALGPALGDDWLLAYNVAESLGRLRADEARPLLSRLAGGHWHEGVRNNAARALAMLDGGDFGRPRIVGDGAAYPRRVNEEGQEILYFGELRYAGDDAARCSIADLPPRKLEQDPVEQLRWRRGGAVRLRPAPVEAETAREIRRRIPVQQVQGRLVAVAAVDSGLLVAFNGGEFGGGVYHLPHRGPARALFEEPVFAAWTMGGKLYAAAGLNHLVMDRGHLYAVDPRRLQVERVIRLPASPTGIAAMPDRSVVLRTSEGAVAIREDGQLLHPERVAECRLE